MWRSRRRGMLLLEWEVGFIEDDMSRDKDSAS
jgi:hypothetical protein